MIELEPSARRYSNQGEPSLTHLPRWGMSLSSQHYHYHLYPPKRHRFHCKIDKFVLLHTFSQGKGLLTADHRQTRKQEIEAHSTFLLPANQYFHIDFDDPPEYIAIGIELDVAPTALIVDMLTIAPEVGINTLFSELRRSLLADTAVDLLYLDALSKALVQRVGLCEASLPDKAVQGAETLTLETVQTIKHYVDQHIGKELKVNRLADVAGFSRSHFSRAFTNSVGVSPQRFVLLRRVSLARHYLSMTSLPITDIANLTGFSSLPHLSVAFKKEMMLSPRHYRERFTTRA